jgi:hypothetical protein
MSKNVIQHGKKDKKEKDKKDKPKTRFICKCGCAFYVSGKDREVVSDFHLNHIQATCPECGKKVST